MTKVRAHELREKSKDQLVQQLEELRGELANLRVMQVTGSAANKMSQIKQVRKNIARVLTVYNAQRRTEARKALAGAKFLPKDLRVKKTRAMRRALTKEQKAKVTLRQQKRAANFPARKYAVLA